MFEQPEERRRTQRRDTWSRALVLWLGAESSFSIKGHIRDISAEGCSLVSLSAVNAEIGAIAALDLDISSRFQVTHRRREGLLQVTGMRFLASMPG
jgi:hypothetical protein